jgi:uncharacterized protein (DUF433 family)
MSEFAVIEHITTTPDVCGGRPRIAGSRVRVQDVALLYERQAQTPDEIVAAYPSIGLADVHAALAYYYDHRDEIRRMIAEDESLAATLRASIPSKRSPLRSEGTAGAAVPS